MLAAGDTFRAAAVEQLQVWGERNHIAVVVQSTGADSASVIFDAMQSAAARNIDVLIADTAGRLQNKNNLIEKFSKSNTEHIEKYIKLKEEIYNVWRDNREKQLELGNKDIEIRVDNKDVLKEFKELFKKVLENNCNIDDLKETLKNYENKYNKIHNITNIEEHKEEQIKKYELEKNKYIRQNEVENKSNKLELD